MYRFQSILRVGVLFSVACNGASNDSPPREVGACIALCDAIGATGCPNDDRERCLDDCGGHADSIRNGCGPSTSEYLECTARRVAFACDPAGFATPDADEIASLCAAELDAHTACAACKPFDNDREQELCAKRECCAESTALADPRVAPFHACLDACDLEPSCTSGCAARFPTASPVSEAWLECVSTKCDTK